MGKMTGAGICTTRDQWAIITEPARRLPAPVTYHFAAVILAEIRHVMQVVVGVLITVIATMRMIQRCRHHHVHVLSQLIWSFGVDFPVNVSVGTDGAENDIRGIGDDLRGLRLVFTLRCQRI